MSYAVASGRDRRCRETNIANTCFFGRLLQRKRVSTELETELFRDLLHASAHLLKLGIARRQA